MKKNNLPGIALFAYNRPVHLKKTLNSLMKNYNSSSFDIFIFCDGPKKISDLKKVKKVREIVSDLKHFKSKKVRLNKKNLGLANSLLQGITETLKKKESVVVLEDDLITNKYYLNFMSEGLEFFKNDNRVGSITGYSYTELEKSETKDVFLSQRHASWGWGTWRHLWNNMNWEKKWALKQINNLNFKKNFNKAGKDMHQMLVEQLEGKSDTLDIMVNLNYFKMNKYCVCPRKSLLFNVGLDGTGIHCKKGDKIFNNFSNSFKVKKFEKITPQEKIIKRIAKSFTTPLHLRVYNKLIRILF
jgi:GT2 family glycosyltransferase